MTLFEPARHEPVHRANRRGALTAGLLSTALAVSVLGGGIYVIQNPQPILDQFTVWQFEPSAEIVAQTERLALTDHGRFLYYASQPEINSDDSFDSLCPNIDEEGDFGILGCYLPDEKRIHLFDVTDPRLDGTEEVTAAHELLHAAWDRLGNDERTRLSALIESEADRLSDNTEFRARMEYYARVEPGERENELHSIIGTEATDISEELEDYYAKYFEDRSLVTDLHATANAVFVDLREQSEELVSVLESLRTAIESDYEKYTSGYAQLNADIIAFNTRVGLPPEEGGLGAFQEDEERAALTRRQTELDALYASILERSDQFDALLVELESLNAETAELQRGLNVGDEVRPED